LPPIGRLADEFEVSRDTVQRSIQMLSDEGKVTRWPGLGWYVSEAGSKG
jgi:DNA-binding GntR family transcriptional regulator